MYSQLELKQQVDFENLKSKLGKPVGEINLTKSSVLKIYSPHLTLQIKNSALTKINLIQESLLSSSFTSENTWTLGRYTYGASRKQLQQYFPKNTYETENEVAIENDKYTLSLGFDTRQNISTLIEAEILLWF